MNFFIRRKIDVFRNNTKYAKNESNYDEIHQKLEDTNIKTVIDYFNKNWHGIRTEWVVHFQSNL